MREIKFRAWDIEKKYFKYPKLWDNSMPSNWAKFYILLQYTGLKDKNGKEIYEGDIIKTGISVISRVYYNGAGFKAISKDVGCLSLLRYATQKRVEVIGNIYENPELINK